MGFFNTIKNILNEKIKIIDIVNIIGSISYNNTSINISSNGFNLKNTIDVLQKIIDDEKYNHIAVVFRINSPGGNPGSAEEVANMINKLRDKNILTIASICDLGCSAAYLIASQCDIIFANKMSIVGSIGVLMPISNVTKLSEKIGASIVYFKAGKMKDIGNMFREVTDEEKDYIEYVLNNSHKEFINMVKAKRNIINEDMFDGRFLDAITAKENNLIDYFGGFTDVIEFILKRFNIEKGDIKIKEYEKKQSFIKRVLSGDLFTIPISFKIADMNYLL